MISPCLFAAPPPSVRHVGVLGVSDPRGTAPWAAFVEELGRRGFVEGKTVLFVFRECGERLERLDALAKELVGLGVDLVVSLSPGAMESLRRTTQSVPLVMTASRDPVNDGWVASLAHPGGNITGNAVSSPDIELKQFELLIEALGKPKRIAYVVFEANRAQPIQVQLTARFETMARSRGVQLETHGVVDGHVLDDLFRRLAGSSFSGVVLQNHATIGLGTREVALLGLRHRLPIVMAVRDYSRAGVLFAFGPTLEYLYGKAGVYVSRILSGEKPAELPVEFPTKFEFVVNLKTATALGLTIPPSILLRADEVIQ